MAVPQCRKEMPVMVKAGPAHLARCHLVCGSFERTSA